MNASLKFLASFLTYSVLAGNPALSAPLYLQCGWGEPATDAYTFDIDIQNKTVHIVVPSLDAYDVNVGEYVIEFSANRSVRYLTGGIQLGVSKSARYSNDEILDSITRFTINRVTGEFEYTDTPLDSEQKYPPRDRVNGSCRMISRLF